MNLLIIDGDLLQQNVEVIVNAWNRNIIPWWLLLPQGVSGAIKRRAGLQPFGELGCKGFMPLGSAVETNAGRLPYRAIIHVAGINMLWRSSERSIRKSVRSAMALVKSKGYRSVAFPLIGAGSGGGTAADVQEWMVDELSRIEFPGVVRIAIRRSPDRAPLRSSVRGQIDRTMKTISVLLAALLLFVGISCDRRSNSSHSPTYGDKDLEVVLPKSLGDMVNCSTEDFRIPWGAGHEKATIVLLAKKSSKSRSSGFEALPLPTSLSGLSMK
jgi:O-acetyl-ADP-ribose deacetylase